jgi:hypothetical protein
MNYLTKIVLTVFEVKEYGVGDSDLSQSRLAQMVMLVTSVLNLGQLPSLCI